MRDGDGGGQRGACGGLFGCGGSGGRQYPIEPEAVGGRPGWEWPFPETDTHWIALGMHRDLNQAFRIALGNTLDFLTRRARLTRLDAYSLASLATSFRLTQVVNINQGVHAMLPKQIFARELRETIRVV